MKEAIERIYRNCYCEATRNNMEKNNKYKEMYIAIGKALKEVLDKEKNDGKTS